MVQLTLVQTLLGGHRKSKHTAIRVKSQHLDRDGGEKSQKRADFSVCPW